MKYVSVAFISETGSLMFALWQRFSGTLLLLKPFSIPFTPDFLRKRIALFQAPFSAFLNYLFPYKLQS